MPSPGGAGEDTVITGYLRHKVGWVRVRGLEGGLYGWLWDYLLSSCSLLGFLKNVFLNPFVLEKNTNHVEYVNSVRFPLCVMLETVIYEYLMPIGIHLDHSKYCIR